MILRITRTGTRLSYPNGRLGIPASRATLSDNQTLRAAAELQLHLAWINSHSTTKGSDAFHQQPIITEITLDDWLGRRTKQLAATLHG